MENLEFGLLLMIVGMITVFIILLIVINLSRLLIAAVNKFAPEEAPATPKRTSPKQEAIDNNAMAAIKAAVNIITNGKGKVVNVEKI